MKKTTRLSRYEESAAASSVVMIDDEPRAKRQPKLKLVESDEELSASGSVEIVPSVYERLVASMSEPLYHPRVLVDDEAEIVVAVLWLAQEMRNVDAVLFLQVGGAVELPLAQQGTITRPIYASIRVTPVLATLVSSRFRYDAIADFRLRCQFIVGTNDVDRQGLRANNERVPYPLQRPNALELSWTAFNSAIHTETPGDNRQLVVFIDKPNLSLFGDRFYISTSQTGSILLNTVGTSPNDSQSDIDRSTASALHFYDEFFEEVAADCAQNMYNESPSHVASAGSSVNIAFSNGNTLTTGRWSAAIAAAKQYLTTPARIEAAVRNVIKNGEKFV